MSTPAQAGAAGTDEPTLKDRIAVVTGGSSGIGAACVRALAAEGARVVIGYHRGEERAEALRASLPGGGHRCVSLPLTDSAAHAQLARLLEADEGRLDILINSAGFTRRVPHQDLAQLEPALFNEILLANAGGTYSVIRALMPLLKASKEAVVVSLSSISAFTGSGSSIAYCAAKAALDTMTLSLARAHGPVRFLCVSPASVDTDFIPGRDRAELEKKAARTPLGRIVTPEDVALAALACITHLRTATGTRMVIDGGYRL